MGCCQSTATAVPKSNHPDSLKSQAAPPPVIEEEPIVKEVLTETPIPKPPTPALIHSQPNKQTPQIQQLKIKPEPEPELKSEVNTEKEEIFKPAAETLSEVSELCSFTESYSTTTALTEKRDDDEEGVVTQRVNRSPAKVPRKRQYTGEHLRGRDKGVVRSPAKRPVPSPERKRQLPLRSVAGRNTAAEPQRRNVGGANTVRRDSADGSSRRSRSPATRGEVGQRPSVRHSSPSLTSSAGGRRPAVEKVEKKGTVDKLDGGGGGGAGPEPRESLDNPLVSLECFIFL